jgi:hypothetical protein
VSAIKFLPLAYLADTFGFRLFLVYALVIVVAEQIYLLRTARKSQAAALALAVA